MALMITEECINCGACEPECPNNAIYEAGAKWKYSEGTGLKGLIDLGDGSNLDAELFIEPVPASWLSSAHLNTRSISLCAVFAATTIGLAPGCRTATSDSPAPDASVISTKELVGRWQTNHVVTPVNQILTPAGLQVDLPEMRPQALALSPDGRLLVTAGKTSELVLVDPVTGKILQKVPLPSDQATDPAPGVVSTHILDPDKDGQLSFTGLIFSPDGKRIYLSNVNGSIKVFDVSANGVVTGRFSISLPKANAPKREAEIPSGLALSGDGRRLYVVFNLSNRLAELDALTGELLRAWDVGFAPYDVVLAGDKAYVSNWGGRRPDATSVTGPGGRGTLVRVDPVRHIASEGSVSVIDLKANRVLKEILTGLHASALAVAPGERHVVVARSEEHTSELQSQ